MDDLGDADETVRSGRFLASDPVEGPGSGSAEPPPDGGAVRSGRFLAPDPAGDPGSGERLSDGDDGWRAPAAKARLVVVAVALLVVGVLIGRLTAPDSEADVATGVEEDAGTDSPPATFPAGDQSREPWWGLVGFQRLAVDTFDRADASDGLGETGTGETWETPTGKWGIEGGSPGCSPAIRTKPNIAIVPASEGDGLVEVTMATPEQGAGLVFRYQDPSNYWAVTTSTSLGTWAVTRTVDGEAEAVAELNAPVTAGTTITVILTGTQVRFLVDSVDTLSLDDSTFAGVRQAGLIAPADSPLEARWDRFLTMDQPPEEAEAGE